MEYKQLFDKVDIEISKGKDNYVIDDRINSVNYNKFFNESYELFRLHLSEYLDNPIHNHIKKKIEKIISNDDLTKKIKRDRIRLILFKIINKALLLLFQNETSGKDTGDQEGGKQGRLLYVVNKLPDLTNYELNNNREICDIHKSKDQCNKNKHCYWSYDECHFALTRDIIITFVNKVSEELAINEHKASEILKKNNYFVSDIADYSKFEERKGQKIVKSTNNTINKVLVELFGKENIPKIGKRRTIKTSVTDLQEMNLQNPLQNMGDYHLQKIIDDNITIIRSFANGYTWLKYLYYDIESRNLGFYSNLQTDMANYFRSNIVDWIADKNNYDTISKDLKKYLELHKKNAVNDYINKISKDISTNTPGTIEYYVLNKIYKIPIIVYDKYNTILYIIDDGIIYDKFINEKIIDDKKFSKYKDPSSLKNYINIRYVSLSMSNIPVSIEVAYFK
jgi:hypothetical protein